MKRLFFVLALLLPGGAAAQDPSGPAPAVSAGASLAGTSAFVWRGFTIGDRSALQPAVWVRVGPLTVSSWTNLWRPGGERTLDEHDLTVEYTRQAGRVSLSAGWINYFFPGAAGGRHSNELFGRVAVDGPLAPTLTVFQDVHQGSGTYISLQGSHGIGDAGPLKFTASGGVGFNHHQWTDVSGFSDLSVGVKAAAVIHRRLSVAPSVTYSRSLSAAIGPSRLVWGLELTGR